MRHQRPTRLARPVLAAVLAIAGLTASACGDTQAAPSPAPPSSPAAAPSGPTPPSLEGTRPLSPARPLFTVNVPTRFVDVPPGAPEAAAVPPLAQALQRGVGVLTVDRETSQRSGSGYAPTVGGLCSAVPSQDLDQLGAALRQSAEQTGTPTAPPRVEVLPAIEPTASQRVTISYPADVNGRALSVVQVAALAAPGRGCVLSISTDDAARDAETVRTVRDSFRVPPA